MMGYGSWDYIEFRAATKKWELFKGPVGFDVVCMKARAVQNFKDRQEYF